MDTKARFTRMQDGTAEEFALIEAAETEYASTLPTRVLDAVRALETGGAQGYAVSRLEHSLQSATRAERDGRPVDYVVAALVHDIGDGLAPYSHGSYAASVLRPFVSEELCWIVSHHPLFQMFYYGPHMGGDKIRPGAVPRPPVVRRHSGVLRALRRSSTTGRSAALPSSRWPRCSREPSRSRSARRDGFGAVSCAGVHASWGAVRSRTGTRTPARTSS